ncbi:MAG: mechanosensitive ion channel [Planctomycetes bacterium]|nr:mechanosensitive ion channel [Planctomycetota bacterium]
MLCAQGEPPREPPREDAAPAAAAKPIAASERLRSLAAEGDRFEAERAHVLGLAESTRAAREIAAAALAALEADFRKSRAAVAAAGMNHNLGVLFRERRRKLPEPREIARRIEEREAQFEDAVARLFESRDRRDNWSIEGAVAAGLAKDGAGRTPEEVAALATALRARAARIAELHASISGGYERIEEELGEHDRLDRALVQLARRYAAFIDARILWLASAEPLEFGDIGRALSAGSWFFDAGEWRLFATTLFDEVLANRAEAIAVLLVLLILFGARSWLRPGEKSAAEPGAAEGGTAVGEAFRAVLETLPAAALIWAAGHFASYAGHASSLADGAGVALGRGAYGYLFLASFLRIAAPGGVAEAQFSWPPAIVAVLRAACRFGITFLLPLYLVVVALAAQPRPEHGDSLGRAAFIAGMIGCALFAARVLRPRSPALTAALASEPGRRLARFAKLWLPAAAGVPAALALLAALGYFHTALVLELRLRSTIAYVVGLAVAGALALRWLTAAGRRLAEDHARIAEAERQWELLDAGVSSESGAVKHRLERHLHVPMAKVDAHSREMLRFLFLLALVLGLGGIWSETLPVIATLDRVQLLPEPALLPRSVFQDDSDVAHGARGGTAPAVARDAAPAAPAAATPAAGPELAIGVPPEDAARSAAEPSAAKEGARRLTLANLVVALIVLAVAVVASKNIPGLLEIAIFGRLPLDASARYAITTIARYAILFGGLWMTLAAVGIGWSNVQWLAAALTFGLAFGLQEVFANFVSGVIILFERPIRIGDVVTLGSMVGKVTKIRMRATTILDKDRRELLVPNKEFITQQLINWTLSDPITCVTVPVGVAYGSDTKLARQLLLEAAAESELVLDDPAPHAYFRNFGASALDFELRAFISDYDELQEVTHDLHERIDAKFRAAKIEIAFPQLDVHVRNGPLGAGAERLAGET